MTRRRPPAFVALAALAALALVAIAPAAAAQEPFPSRPIKLVVPVAAGGGIAMKPGGLHIMLMGLKAPLKPGTKLPVTLRFEKAGLVRASLPVLPPGAQGPAAGGHHGH